jgi:hypothetical protein
MAFLFPVAVSIPWTAFSFYALIFKETIMKRSLLVFAASVLLLGIMPAFAQSHVKTGTLDCDVSGGIGLILGSNKAIRCYYISRRGYREIYEGSIQKYGLDVGATERARMIWAVYAPTNTPHYGLAGDYVGGTAEATVGAGVGANVLVGGSQNTISLQPLSVSAQEGLNVAAGVGALDLHPVSPIRSRHR